MFTIVKRRELNPTVTELCIHAPLIAKKAKAGQFIIVRAKEDSERISLTIAGFDREAGTVSIIFQVVGAGTMQLNSLKEGEAGAGETIRKRLLQDFNLHTILRLPTGIF